MKPNKAKKWLERVEYDIQTAGAMFDTGRYIYAIFMCQQAIEKSLKAVIAHTEGEILPIHNLRRLFEISGLINQLNEEKLKKIDFLTQYYINARYKEDIAELSRGITQEFTSSMITFTKEMIRWIVQEIK